MSKDFLDTEFESFKKAATDGYKIARKQHKNLEESIKTAKEQILEVLNVFNKSSYMDTSVTESLGEQLVEISKSFDTLEIKTNNDLQNLKMSLSRFSITLFGRTMAGKSTLMEFLTHGSGESIGMGGKEQLGM